MPDNRLASHKRQNTGFRRANQVEVDFFSVVPETLSLAELPALSSTSGAVWSGFSSGGLIDYRCSNLLLPVGSHSLRPDVSRMIAAKRALLFLGMHLRCQELMSSSCASSFSNLS